MGGYEEGDREERGVEGWEGMRRGIGRREEWRDGRV